MASIKETQVVEKLNATNYAIWKFRVEMLLIREELFEVITDDPPNPLTADWNKKDSKARAIINLVISDEQIVNVRNKTTARETWETLKSIHERANLSSKLYLLRKLYSLKMPEEGNMTNHLTKILQIIEQLAAIGEDIAESHISALMLCSIPSSYDALVTALEARPEQELTPEFIRSKLIDEYTRRIENKSFSSDTGTKAYQIGNKKGNFNKPNKFCSNCRLSSHDTSDCWHLNNRSKHTNNNRGRGNTNFRRNFRSNFRGNKYNNRENYKSSLCFESNESKYRENTEDTHKDQIETNTRKLNDFTFLTEKTDSHKWVVDSGSSAHICNDQESFINMTNEETNVVIANGNTVKSYGSGDIKINTITPDGETCSITLKQVLFVPEIETNLLSVRKATQNGCKVVFEENKCIITYKETPVLEAKIKNNLYEVITNKNDVQARIIYDCNDRNCVSTWHKRLGHRNHVSIKEMVSKQIAQGITLNKCSHSTQCDTCDKSKLTESPYPKIAQNRSKRILQLIHSDLCGPFRTPTISGKKYILTFTDDYSRYTMIYLLENKSEVFYKFKEYVSLMLTKFGRIPQILRSDNGGEYVNNQMVNYLKEKGIEHQLSVPFSPPQNGIAERKNRTIVETIRSLLTQSNLPHRFWGEAAHTANYIINRLPTKSHNKSPLEMWINKKPNLSYLKVFGCKAFAYINKTYRGKLDNRAKEGIFVGYDQQSTGYRIYTGGNNVIISRSVKFVENDFPYDKTTIEQNPVIENKTVEKIPNSDSGGNTLEVDLNYDKHNDPEIIVPVTPRRSQRVNKGVPPDRFVYMTKHEPIEEPKDYKAVLELENPLEKENWLNATKEEMNSLQNNKTWKLVDPPQGKKVIGSKWLFKAKYDSNGRIQKYKARLVAKGFLQKYGVDYDETFAPVVSHTTIRTFLAAAKYKKLKVQHVDIKTAFLHGDLEEEVYMSQPEGYIIPGQENKVCKLQKAIYGLKQAARQWHLKIGESLKRQNFVQSTADSCLYVQKKEENSMFIIVYVDDILIAGTEAQIKEVIQNLKEEYEVKDLGEVSYYLGIKIEQIDDESFSLNQKSKIEEIIKKFGLEESKPTYTPMETGYLKLEDDDKLLPNNTKYRQAIGALLYVATVSRPDISATINILSRRNENPREKDWQAVKRVIRYLKTTKDLNLVYNINTEPILKCYTDSDWGGDTENRKSTSGNLFLLGKNPIQWSSKKQSCIALSTAEAEYVSASNATQEIIWLMKLLEDLDLKQEKPITIYEDNLSCIKMIQNEKYTARTKHIDIKYNSVKHLKQTGLIDLIYCPTKLMIADVLTKPLPKPDFERHRGNLQLLKSNIMD